MDHLVSEKIPVLVVGAGSIGERHARCFLATGARVSLSASRVPTGWPTSGGLSLSAAYTAWETLPLRDYAVVVICTRRLSRGDGDAR